MEKEHGGIAKREYYITEDVKWYSGKKEWKKLTSFGMVHKTLEKPDGSIEKENRYYICSIKADADEFERAARRHWGVENNLHWQLDFTFQDDKNTSMAKTGAKNLQIMKKIVMSILRLVKETYKMSMKKMRYELSLDYENGVELAQIYAQLYVRPGENAGEQHRGVKPFEIIEYLVESKDRLWGPSLFP